MPNGQELMKSAIAVPISRPANQSVTIFVISTLSSTPPIPAATRAADCGPQSGTAAITSPPATIKSSASDTTRRSPNRRARPLPGSATTIPGRK